MHFPGAAARPSSGSVSFTAEEASLGDDTEPAVDASVATPPFLGFFAYYPAAPFLGFFAFLGFFPFLGPLGASD
jgi:hypothetical protein